MSETTKFNPSPYQALIDAGFSPGDARKAIITITAEGYEMPYNGPRRAYIMDNIAFQVFAHSTKHAESIFNDSGIGDGPCEIHQNGHVFKLDYLNVEGSNDFTDADWDDAEAERWATAAGVPDRDTSS